MMLIRKMTGPDLPRVLEVLANLAPADMGDREAAEVFQEQMRHGSIGYVAQLDGLIVGTATLLIDRKFIHHGGLVGRLEDLAVHRDWQRQGVGSAMVWFLIAEARAAGCYKLILNCHANLVSFYQRFGLRMHDVGLRIDMNEGK